MEYYKSIIRIIIKTKDMNNTSVILNEENIEYIFSSVINYATRVFAPLMNINFVIICIFSISWAFYFVRKLWKDYRKEKITFKMRDNQPEYLWINAMENFKSNRIKNIFLLAICLSETVYTLSILLFLAFDRLTGSILSGFGKDMEMWTNNPSVSFPGYYELIGTTFLRTTWSFIIIPLSALAFFIRILTQYMVHQYSYYKPHLNIKFQVYISLTPLLVLFILMTVFKLITVCSICIVLLLVHEYILLIIASRKLCLLLRQHLYDAIRHENQSKLVILYYQIAYKEYKYCSIIILIALFAQFTGASLYLLNQIVIHFVEYTSYWSLLTPITCSLLQLMFISIGTSIQIILYLIVSIRRLVRYIYKRINVNKQISSMSSLKRLIAEHNTAYIRRSGNRNML